MKRIENFKSIIDKYDIIFFDAFGVIKTYQGLVPGIEKTFAYLEAKNKELREQLINELKAFSAEFKSLSILL